MVKTPPKRGIEEVGMRFWSVRSLFCTGLLFAVISATPFPVFRNIGQASVSAAALQPYGGCAAPATAGINVCEPGEPNPFAWEVPGVFQVIAAATSGTGQVALMEVWADGKKLAQTKGTPFDEPITLGGGLHTLTVVEVDTTGTVLKSRPFQVSVQTGGSGGGGGNGCSPPSDPGVHLCSPDAGGCNSQSWVDIDATGRGASGAVDRMELWIDGTKIANFPGDQIGTSLIMVYGEVQIVEVDSKGHSKSTSFFFNGPC